jgi:hypothetical protein
MKPLTILARAFTSNVRALAVSPEEQAALGAQGISDPTVQRYLLWRRATVLMVIVATLLSAAVSTYSTLTESDEQPDFMESLSELFLQKIESAVPAVAKLGLTADTATTVIKEKKEAQAEKEADATKDDDKKPRLLGSVVDEGTHLLSLYLMPIAALIVLFLGHRFRTACRILVAAFLLSFFLPMLIALLPWSVWEAQTPPTTPIEVIKDQAEGLMEGAQTLLALLPAVLSLIPGLQKACLRVKTLLPQSSTPGWFIIVASPLYGLFLLVIFVAVDQVTTQPAILASLGLLALASFFYVFRPGIFTRPLLTEADYRRMRGVQRIVGLITALAGGILVAYLVTSEVLGIHLIGLDPSKSLMRPIDLVEYGLEIISRSMFVSVVGAEVILRLNLAAWQQGRALATSEAATPYDEAMEATAAIV